MRLVNKKNRCRPQCSSTYIRSYQDHIVYISAYIIVASCLVLVLLLRRQVTENV